MVSEILDNTGSGNGLWPDGIKPSPEPILTYHEQDFLAFITGQYLLEYARYQSRSCVWNIHIWYHTQGTISLLWWKDSRCSVFHKSYTQFCIVVFVLSADNWLMWCVYSYFSWLLHWHYQWLNSLAPGRSGCNFKSVTFNLVLLIGIFRSSNDNVLRWMLQYFTDDKS